MSQTAELLRKAALKLPDTEEGIACAGTKLESRTVNVGGKAFVFICDGNARLKLGDSVKEATALAKKEPDRYKVGANGWAQLLYADAAPPTDLLTRWVAESYHLMAPKKAATAGKAKPAPAKKKSGARPTRR